MSSFNIFQQGTWFGEKSDLDTTPLPASDNAGEAALVELCTRLKSGDFSARSALEEFIAHCEPGIVKRQALRLYSYVARHQDLAFLGQQLEHCEHDEVLSIVTYMPHTLSPEAVPYLFALHEEYEETVVDEPILTSIDSLFPFGYEGGGVDMSELRGHFSGFARSLHPGAYYFNGVPAFAGNLTKDLLQAAAHARHDGTDFPLVDPPILLSIWSGEKCPVFFGGPVKDSDFEATMAYVSLLSTMDWVQGKKYFYGHEVPA
ncbi:Imm47 family immunity protein [Massilia sp. DJPM01]|uniref:Imm47 family immunity protein n=1 Tax=Massilia sp. DJPM01 TaxID=3024404 RepID=UPI00259D69DD|nr:Imm47 family immunity protein [Massilia sp. DJPM01]MDM5179210.1 Imm47 family immunity protein [Massilia sp. DJPM01]